MIECVLDKLLNQNRNLFITGGAGVGKSFFINRIYKSLTKKGFRVSRLSSTGISAMNISGCTIHSFFEFGFSNNSIEGFNKKLKYLSERFGNKSKQYLERLDYRINITDFIIIDEISMVSADMFELIGYICNLFGYSGKFIIVGDFFQLQPVINESKYGQMALFNKKFAFESDFWDSLNLLNYEIINSKRTDNYEFNKYLSLLRVGEELFDVANYFKRFSINNLKHNKDATILTATNKIANTINNEQMALIKSIQYQFHGSFQREFDIENFDESTKEIILKLEENVKKQFNDNMILTLKVGAKIIFTKNVNLNSSSNLKFYNGEQGVIRDIDCDKSIITIQKDSTLLNVELYDVQICLGYFKRNGEEKYTEVNITFRQFPVKLAYALTIHKSQGMSIDSLTCDIDKIFSNGQIYVGISRSSNPTNLSICNSSQYFCEQFIKKTKVDQSVVKFYKDTKFVTLG